MPPIRQISATGTPSCPCFKMNAFWASENLDAFIVFRSSQPKDLGRKTPVKNDPVSGDQITWKDRTMKQSKFTEEQIIAILREQEAGAKTADVCRRHGMSEATFYAWKAKFGGLDVSEARRQARGRRSSVPILPGERAAGVYHHGCGPEHGPVPKPAT